MSIDPAFAAGIHHLTVAKQYATASWVLAVYEYIITFDREVQSIWQRKYSFATVLWVLIYAAVVLLCDYSCILPAIYNTGKQFNFVFLTRRALYQVFFKLFQQCITFVKFPGTIQIISNAATGLTLSLRVYALYGRDWKVFLILVPTFIVEMVIEAWAVAGGVPVPIPPGQVGCILTGKPNQGDRFAAFWIGQLIFPSVIFLLTTGRVLMMKQQGTIKGGITMLLLRDGVMYFAMIFTVNLANVLTYVTAPPDIQAINAPFSALITAMMICRLMLNLRSVGTSNVGNNPYIRTRTGNIISETLVGNLGEALDVVGDWKEPKDDHVRHEFSRSQVYELDTISS